MNPEMLSLLESLINRLIERHLTNDPECFREAESQLVYIRQCILDTPLLDPSLSKTS